METFKRLFLFFLVAWSAAAWGRQDSAPDFTPLNGNWELVVDPLDQVRIFGFLFRVEGDKIYGWMDFDLLLCRRADGRRTGSGWQLSVQGDIAPDGSFTITNEYPLQLPVHTVSVRGVVPAANADQWSGSFSISANEGYRGVQCPAASRDFVARRSQQANSVYSGEVKVKGTEEKAWVTLELSPGGLTEGNGSPPLDRTIGIDAKVTVSPTLWFKGGTFSTNPPQRGWTSQMEACCFTARFPDNLTVSGIFNPWHHHQVSITLTHNDSKGEARWAASGMLTQQ